MDAQGTKFYANLIAPKGKNTSPIIMGILNITPDSFFDGGKYTEESEWLLKCKKMLDNGAKIIDIGAYSSRPNAEHISEKEEEKRLIPVVKSIHENFPNAIISVDTFRANIAQRAIEAGAHIINDISGGTLDDKMYETVARLNVPYMLMHMQGTPSTMQQAPHYDDVTKEVIDYFKTKTRELEAIGVKQLIIDPGFGFGKTIEHNYTLLQNLEELQALNYPVLVGVSRKSMIYKLLNTTPQEALNGTSVINTVAIQKGAKILRVHDVKEAQEVITILQKTGL